MTKKSFKDVNPVMQFITQEPAQSVTDEVKPKTLDQNKNIDEVVNNLESVGANNERAELDRETKSKRLNLLVKPSILDDVKKIAVMRQVSVNDLINQLLDQHRTENHKYIESFNKTFSK